MTISRSISRARTVRPENRTAFQRLQDQLKWVDLIFQVVDARLPLSSAHPQAEKIFGNKPRITILAKEDLADPAVVKEWVAYLQSRPHSKAISLALKESRGKPKLISAALEMTQEKRDSLTRKGILPRAMRVCVVGMPNVGKSSLINWLIGQKKAAVGNKPGVTKGPQWVRVHPQLEMLDTPGILPVDALTKEASLKLAMFNLIPEGHYDFEEVAAMGLTFLEEKMPRALNYYGDIFADIGSLFPESKLAQEELGQSVRTSGITYLECLAKARSCIGNGGRLDTRRAASIFLSDLRNGRLGRITLESPPAPLK